MQRQRWKRNKCVVCHPKWITIDFCDMTCTKYIQAQRVCTLLPEQLLSLRLRADMALQQPLHSRVQRAAHSLHCHGRLPLGEAEPLQLQAGLLHLVRCHQLQSSTYNDGQSAVTTNQQVLIGSGISTMLQPVNVHMHSMQNLRQRPPVGSRPTHRHPS